MSEAVLLAVPAVLVALAVASFACVVIDRLPLPLDEPNEFGEMWDTRPWGEVLGGRSRCSSCGVPVRPVDNIPVLGWLKLRGRCRDCGAAIPVFHLGVELLIPVLAFGMYLAIGASWYLLPALFLVVVGVIVAVIDQRTLIVATRLVWPALAASVAIAAWVGIAEGAVIRILLGSLVGAVTLAGPLFAAWWVHPRGMGFGDVRLAVLLGWHAGLAIAVEGVGLAAFVALAALILSSLVGIVFGLVSVASLGRQFPFGPALVAGTLLTVAFAPEIAQIVTG